MVGPVVVIQLGRRDAGHVVHELGEGDVMATLCGLPTYPGPSAGDPNSVHVPIVWQQEFVDVRRPQPRVGFSDEHEPKAARQVGGALVGGGRESVCVIKADWDLAAWRSVHVVDRYGLVSEKLERRDKTFVSCNICLCVCLCVSAVRTCLSVYSSVA